MTRRLLYIHGAMAQPADPPWDRITAELGTSVQITAPLMEQPDPQGWLDGISRALEAFPEDGLLVGHSLGGSSLLQCVALRNPGRKFAGFVGLALPYWGPGGWTSDGFALPATAGEALSGLGRLCLHHCAEDEIVGIDHLDLYRACLPRAEPRRHPGGNHLFEGVQLDGVVADLQAIAAAPPPA